MKAEELKTKLKLHRKWLCGEDGERAVLTDADLTDADLTGAVLTRAVLTRAVLTRAVLTRAVLTDAVLTRAVLTDADLTDADLTDADLTDADLTRAVGVGGWLNAFRDDVWLVLSWAPAEALAVLRALEEGRVNGSMYSGTCACLVGTIAQARGVDPYTLPLREDAAPGQLARSAESPSERFFMRIRPGHTPDVSTDAALAAGWVRQFITEPATVAEALKARASSEGAADA